ncbi:MAG: hypothetical protein U9N85_10135 [Bacteroidota bacterium]|nr:hypothetical protein [Bacteroidota bacterium]
MKLTINRNNVIAVTGAIFLFLSTLPFFLWSIPAVSIIFFVLFLILAINVMRTGQYVIRQKNFYAFLVLFLYSVYMALPIFGHTFLPGKILLFSPLFVLLFLKNDMLLRIFKIWKILLIFFSAYAILVLILFILKIEMPYWILSDTSYIPEEAGRGHFYKAYGLVVSSSHTVKNIAGFPTHRLCGPFAEPGHFAIYIGLTLLIDKFLGKKLNTILLIAGLLTLSPAFVLIFVLIEGYNFFIMRKINTKAYFIILVAIVSITLVKGRQLKERIIFLTVERHSTIDKRAPLKLRAKYTELIKEEKVLWFGVGTKKFDTFGGSLSDPRGLIAKFGLIGLFFSIVLIVMFSAMMKKKYAVFVFITIAMVYAHRVWMFESVYLFTFMLLAAVVAEIKENEEKPAVDDE